MTTVSRKVRRLGVASLLVGSLVIGVAPAPAAAAKSFTYDVGKRADFVAQTNFVQCVGASAQMMLNMIEPGRDRSAKTQRKLQVLARSWSGPRPDGSQRQGASIAGWAAALNLKGAGPYKLIGRSSLQAALKAAAKAIRQTGKPVGLLMWRGRHAWVMSGFRATADPRRTNDFRVTHAIVEDPLYPHGSSWGPSPYPGEALTVSEIGRQFVRRRTRSQWNFQHWAANLRGKYVMVIPFEPVHSPWATRML